MIESHVPDRRNYSPELSDEDSARLADLVKSSIASESDVKSRSAVVSNRNILILLVLVGLASLAFFASRQFVTQATPEAGAVASVPEPEARPDEVRPGALQASGYVVASHNATVSSDITGRVSEIHVDTGDTVRRDDVIAVLDHRQAEIQLEEARLAHERQKLNIELAEIALKAREKELNRLERLSSHGSVSDRELSAMREETDSARLELKLRKLELDAAANQVRSSEIFLERHTIRAPFDGIVVDVPARVGETVSPSSSGNSFIRTGIAHLIDPSDLLVEVEVPEQHLDRVDIDQIVEVTAPALNEQVIMASVTWIKPVSSRQRGVVVAGIRLPPLEGTLLDGMEVDVRFMTESDRTEIQNGQGGEYVSR